MRRLAPLALLILCACSQTKPTIEWLANRHGLDAPVTATPLGNDRWRIRVDTSTLFLTEDAQALFQQSAEKRCQDIGKPAVEVETMAMGIDNSLTGGRRFAEGVVHCRSIS